MESPLRSIWPSSSVPSQSTSGRCYGVPTSSGRLGHHPHPQHTDRSQRSFNTYPPRLQLAQFHALPSWSFRHDMYILRLRWSEPLVLLDSEDIPFNKSGSPTHGEDVHTIHICRSHFLYKVALRSSKISLPVCSASVDYSRSLHLSRKFRKEGNSPDHTCLGFCLFRKALQLSTVGAIMSTTTVIAPQNPCCRWGGDGQSIEFHLFHWSGGVRIFFHRQAHRSTIAMMSKTAVIALLGSHHVILGLAAGTSVWRGTQGQGRKEEFWPWLDLKAGNT
jgi:hypothetical protein